MQGVHRFFPESLFGKTGEHPLGIRAFAATLPSQHPVKSRTVRRGVLLQVLIFSAIAGAITAAVAIFPNWLPPSASEQADRIDGVFWFVTVICGTIFALVAGVLVYALLRFRAAPGDDTDGPPIHGHAGLEIAWTAIPFALVTSMAIYSAIVLARNDRTGAHPLRVDVTAQQFAWTFQYPASNNVNTTVLRLPVHRPVRLTLHALDVIHSFWVPEFSQKQDAVPGITTQLTITPTKLGTYPIICTELCGLGHAAMRSTVMVMSQQDFDKWASGAGKALSGSGAGKAVFSAQGCSACHTLKAAGAAGKVGPDLDKLPQYAKQANQPLAPFVHESIVDPNAYVQPGYPKNVMPHTYASLPKDQLDALEKFLIDSSGGAK
jgi:cytochrome c oxidase subunit 2